MRESLCDGKKCVTGLFERAGRVLQKKVRFTVKPLDLSHKEEGYIQLVPANSEYLAIRIDKEQDFRIWGVVTYNIKKM